MPGGCWARALMALMLAACTPAKTTPADADAGGGADVPPAFVADPVTLGLSLPPVIPVLWIEIDGARIQRDVEVPGRLRVIEDHDGSHTGLGARPASLTSAIGFQGRGNFTFTLPKKGFAFELQEGGGRARGQVLLGMPKGSDFALYACYTDKTCLRNALVYALGQEQGRWSPRARFVELYLDGAYHGLYMLWERIRRDRDRLPLAAPAPGAAAGDVTGGYILRHEGGGKGTALVGGVSVVEDFLTAPAPGGVVYSFHDPKPEEITGEQRAWLMDHFRGFEAAMQAEAARHRDWIELASWVDHAVIEEVTNNWDGYVHSVYMTTAPGGGRIGMGPLWDFDLAFGNGNVSGYHCRTDTWTHATVRPYPDNVPAYWRQLFADPEFRAAFRCRWQQLRAGPLDLAAVHARIDRWVAFTAAARGRDQQRWPTIGKQIFPNCFTRPSYADEVTALREWIDARVAWLDGQVAAFPAAACGP
jgi:hypothetical protein